MSTYTFRKLNRNNPIEMALIEESTTDPFLGDIVLTKNLNDAVVFLEGDRPVGFAIPRKESDGAYRTGPIYVTPSHRKRGVAKQWATVFFTDKAGRAWIETNNKPSQALFTALGFTPTGKTMMHDNVALMQYRKAQPTASSEAYSFNLKTDIDKRLQKACDDLCRDYKQNGTVDRKYFNAIIDVYLSTGIRMEGILHATMAHEIVAINVTQFMGHAGNKFWGHGAMSVATQEEIVGGLEIDLERLTIKGKILEAFPMTLHLSYGAIHAMKDNPRWLCGVLLHELGHPFNFFLGLGDYVWTNYMLSDGVDILLGNKPNTRKIAILDEKTFLSQIKDPKEQQAFLNDRTSEGVRKVVLSSMRSLPRPHLFHGTSLEYRHDEQLADVLPTRLGYAKELAQYLVYLDKNANTPDVMPSGEYWKMEVVKAAFFIPCIIPVGFVLWLMDFGGDTYDRSGDRVRRMKQHVISQLRIETIPGRKDQLVEDIEALEKLEKEYKTRGGVLQGLMTFFNRGYRKTQQMNEAEKTLEGLLNNDMFTQSHQLARLAK